MNNENGYTTLYRITGVSTDTQNRKEACIQYITSLVR